MSLRSNKTPWVVVLGATVCCERCKRMETMPLPMPLSKLPAYLDSFREQHINCQEPAAE